MKFDEYKREWFGNARRDAVSGLVVALALIPEAIAFSIIAGVDPQVGLYASFCIALVISFVGGRPGMISAATGAMALLMVTLVRDHGLEYLLFATILTGILQILAGVFKLGLALRFVSRSVLTGFINALAILIFMAQLPELTNVGWQTYVMVAGGLAIIYILPRFTKAIPSPLVCIVVLTVISVAAGMDLRVVGDMGTLPSTLPVFLLPNVPLNWETFMIVLPYVIPLVVVGLLESLMTASIVDDLTDTRSNKNRECIGQGVANITSGFFGGMAGCAVIGQTVINVQSGGRGRLSTFLAAVYLLVMILLLADIISIIPMAALVAVMIMVSIGTFSWGSLRDLRRHPKMTSITMIVTVVTVVYTHNLAIGVGVGILFSLFNFARRAAHLATVTSELNEPGERRTYTVTGNLFFVSADDFVGSFDHREALSNITIDVSQAHFWDITSVSALDKVVLKYRRDGIDVEIVGLNDASAQLISKVGRYDKAGADAELPLH